MPPFENVRSLDNEQETAAAIAEPQVGDCFHEMLSYWLFVVYRDGDRVATLAAGAPCTFPEDGKLWEGTLEEFKHQLSYKSRRAGFWVRLSDRGKTNVDGWYEQAKERDET